MIDDKDAGINIMMAEDDDDDYYIFSVALAQTSFTFKLSRAINGEILLKILAESLPDILFLDILMPCQDGRHCIKEIRGNERYDKLPVIVYSSMSDPSTIDYFYRNGSNFYAIKPGSVPELKSILEQILSFNWKSSLVYPPKDGFVVSAKQA